MSNHSKSQAKQMLIKFLQETRNTSDFTFKIRGDESEAKRFIHRMRVELSRMRDRVKEAGRIPKEFKMLIIDLTFDSMDGPAGVTTVVLQKHEGKNVGIAEDMDEIFDDLAGGSVIK